MGAFEWLRRMGIHEAYHLNPTNRVIHWLAIPLELLAVIKLLSLLTWHSGDAALLAIGAVGVVYVVSDVGAGVLMVLGLLGLRSVALRLSTGSRITDAVAAAVLFALPFVIQTAIGHGLFEKGVDDTAKNLAELRRTKSPIPIVLVFYYHLVELLFAAGYRPERRRVVEAYRQEELDRIANDPRVR